MRSEINLRVARWTLAAVLALGIADVTAAAGYGVSSRQQNAVKVGMTQIEVQQILGRPALIFKYRSAPGPIWTYYPSGAVYGTTEFNVEFGDNDTVIAARERALPSPG
jgi:hypothetical protein